MTETKTPYETTVTAHPQWPIRPWFLHSNQDLRARAPSWPNPAGDEGSDEQDSGYEPRTALLHVPTWPTGGKILKLLLVVVREDVPDREGVVVDAVPAYRDGVYTGYDELREALAYVPDSKP